MTQPARIDTSHVRPGMSVREVIAPALERDTAAHAEHDFVGQSVEVEHAGPGNLYQGVCKCGWRATRTTYKRATANRSSGLHIAAAGKRSDRQFDVDSADLLDALHAADRAARISDAAERSRARALRTAL